ncbi:protein QUIRKY [Prunus yedoensis var. nudiflora]|uniref:Protein QUIRKY n=1 Tax=Prunus yedoensis var. nudiflora TaxID=2094558 RepID=A0A314ZFY3_PRUYE|nr:protein QUIRKY [Prunus yedoensis var. nudiflora]
MHLRLCFDSGYHVMDEVAHVAATTAPRRDSSGSPTRTVELGVIRCKNMIPVKTVNGKGCTDAYCVAKYGAKWGEVEIAVRFVLVSPTLDLVNVYSQPSLSLMHHIKPLRPVQQDVLRRAAMKIMASHLSRSEPPLGRDGVLYMLDTDSQGFIMRRVRANYFRIINVVAGVMDVVGWINDTRSWKNPMATILVHALLALLVWFLDLLVPTLAFYVFVIGAWNYRFRSRAALQHFDPKLSLVESVDCDELDEEFDSVPSTRSFEVVRARYDKLRMLGARVQTVLGDFVTQGERVQALVTWRDPRATGIFRGVVLRCGSDTVHGAIEDGGYGVWVLLSAASDAAGFELHPKAAFSV